MKLDEKTVNWLLEDENPSIAFLTRIHLLNEALDSPKARKARQAISKSPFITALLTGQRKDGGFGRHPYDKWMGAHWRLRSMVDLAIPPGDKRAILAVKGVLEWLTSPHHQKYILLIDGRTRRCASQEGNALGVCSLLGMAKTTAVRRLAESLVSWQWPDGGWNCDRNPAANHSSFHESVIPMWGLLEYHRATGDKDSLATARRTAEFILRHRLFRAEKDGKIINPNWIQIRYPHYWHYNILQGLMVLSLAGKISDARAGEALNIIESKRCPDGGWKADGYYWKGAMAKERYSDPVNWWRGKPNKMITLNALRVLKSSGRLSI